MKKLLLLLLAFTSVSFSQTTERKSLFKSNLGYEITEMIKENDTMVYFQYTFQNLKYTMISDFGIVLIYKKADLKILADKLIEFSEKPKSTEITFISEKFSLNLYNFSDMIYIEDWRKKYTTFSKEKAKKIAAEIYTKIELLKN